MSALSIVLLTPLAVTSSLFFLLGTHILPVSQLWQNALKGLVETKDIPFFNLALYAVMTYVVSGWLRAVAGGRFTAQGMTQSQIMKMVQWSNLDAADKKLHAFFPGYVAAVIVAHALKVDLQYRIFFSTTALFSQLVLWWCTALDIAAIGFIFEMVALWSQFFLFGWGLLPKHVPQFFDMMSKEYFKLIVLLSKKVQEYWP